MQPVKVRVLHVASQCLGVLVDSAVLSRQIYSIVLVGDLHLPVLEAVLDYLRGLGIVLGCVVLDLLRYL